MEVVDWNPTEAEVLFVPKTLEETQAEVVLLTGRNEYEERRWQAVEEILEAVRTRSFPIGEGRQNLKDHIALVSKGPTSEAYTKMWGVEDKVLKLAGLWPRGK